MTKVKSLSQKQEKPTTTKAEKTEPMMESLAAGEKSFLDEKYETGTAEVPDIESMVPPKKVETRGRKKKPVAKEVAPPEPIDPVIYSGIFIVISLMLEKRFGEKWKFTDEEIKALSNSFAPLAEKYGAAFLQYYPEFMFASTALTIIMSRI